MKKKPTFTSEFQFKVFASRLEQGFDNLLRCLNQQINNSSEEHSRKANKYLELAEHDINQAARYVIEQYARDSLRG